MRGRHRVAQRPRPERRRLDAGQVGRAPQLRLCHDDWPLRHEGRLLAHGRRHSSRRRRGARRRQRFARLLARRRRARPLDAARGLRLWRLGGRDGGVRGDSPRRCPQRRRRRRRRLVVVVVVVIVVLVVLVLVVLVLGDGRRHGGRASRRAGRGARRGGVAVARLRGVVAAVVVPLRLLAVARRLCGRGLLGAEGLEGAVDVAVQVKALVRPGLVVVAPRLQVLLHLALHRRVPVVLDGVVGAARESGGDFGPLVADARVRL
mmetsp:Transcript_32263/g.108669  ORF Transcript_32263/g.108669 Transcript_32263/m.108669 type:complete len:262 (+) Transcript_32263:541-1326(+)